MPVAIPIVVSAALSGFSAAAPALAAGAAINWSAVMVATAIGAGVGALSLVGQKRPGTPRSSGGEINQTTSIRNLPVPIVFGKGRLGGNYIKLGRFFQIKDDHDGTPGRRLQIIHAVIGICEGNVRKMFNVYLDGKTLADISDDEDLPEFFKAYAYTGVAGEILPRPLRLPSLRGDLKYPMKRLYGWRNTCKVFLEAIVGEKPRLMDFNCDIWGQDLKIFRAHLTHENNPADVIRECFYDGYSEAFYATLHSSASAPGGTYLGIVKMPRERSVRTYTPAPAAASGDIRRGWYVGRHDVLVLQDPSSESRFFIGRWQLASDSSQWEDVLLPEYTQPILAHYLDELNVTLHTFHEGEHGFGFINRWNLLTGRITRLDTDRANESENLLALGFMFAPDLNAYVIGYLPNRLYLIDAESGKMYHRTRHLDLLASKFRGFCVSGQRIGCITTSGLVYYDPNEKTIETRYGDGSDGIEKGAFGAISNAQQNSWTGQVAMAKQHGGSAAYINFVPSVLPMEDYGKGTPNAEGMKGADPLPSEKDGWVRDWSARSFNHFSLTALEGQSAVAAAMWNLLVDEPVNDSGRWGAGMKKDWFKLPSFESVHAYCCGGVLRMNNKGKPYYAERYRLDLVLDSERSASDVLVQEILAAINGFRSVIDGQLHVSVQRPSLPIAWHFTDHQIADGKPELAFLGRTTGINRVRIEFTDTDDNFRRNFAEANDEFDQDARGRVMTQTVTLNGLGRAGHADLLAKHLLDQIMVLRRQVTLTTHYLGLVLLPGDGIEVSSTTLGIDRVKFRIGQITENEDGTVKIIAVEHAAGVDSLKHAVNDAIDDPALPLGCDGLFQSAEARLPMPMSVIHPGVYEYPNLPRVVPMAGVPLKAKFIGAVAVYYSFTGSVHDYHPLGTLTSGIGGFLPDNVTATQTGVPYDGAHGDTDVNPADSDTPTPIYINRPNNLGTQSDSGSEIMLGVDLDEFNRVWYGPRPSGKAWSAIEKTAAKVFTVSGIIDECGPATATYRQARDACTISAGDNPLVDKWLAASAVPYFPYYVFELASGNCYKFDSGDAPLATAGTLLSEYEVISEGDSRCCGGSGTTDSTCSGGCASLFVTISGSSTSADGVTELARGSGCAWSGGLLDLTKLTDGWRLTLDAGSGYTIVWDAPLGSGGNPPASGWSINRAMTTGTTSAVVSAVSCDPPHDCDGTRSTMPSSIVVQVTDPSANDPDHPHTDLGGTHTVVQDAAGATSYSWFHPTDTWVYIVAHCTPDGWQVQMGWSLLWAPGGGGLYTRTDFLGQKDGRRPWIGTYSKTGGESGYSVWDPESDGEWGDATVAVIG